MHWGNGVRPAVQELGPEELSELLVACPGAQHRSQLCLREPGGEPRKAAAISWLCTAPDAPSPQFTEIYGPGLGGGWSCEDFEVRVDAEKSKSRQQPLWLWSAPGEQQRLDVLLALVAMPEGCWCQWVQMKTEEIIFVTLRWSN